MSEKKYRYPGVQPFKASDKDIFFGRNEDRDKLYNLIQLEKLVVLFGKSGYGKSSLLNAGIMPLLTDTMKADKFRFSPIEVRLGNYAPTISLAPLQTLKAKLDEKCADTEEWSFLQTDSLWAQFKRKQSRETQRIVLIFDQFEEFFSYPAEQQEAFRWQLADLLFTDIPQSLRDRFDELTDEEVHLLSNSMNIKVVFSIRADRMSLMDGLKDALPTILHKRYELRSLTPTQAQEAIEKPASIVDTTFSTPPFEYTDSALKRILTELTSEQTKGVEAFQLQIVCEEIEKEVEKGEIPDRDGNGLPDVDIENLPDFKNLYENYYRRKLAELPPSVQTAAQRVLEDGLLAEDAATGEGRRMSVDSRALLGQFSNIGLTETLLVDLEKTYLIRREVNTVAGFSFEISHDTLVAPIQKAKAERRAIEEKERLEQEQLEREQQLVEAKKQADIERKRRQRATVLSVISGIALVLALGAMFWAFQKQNEAVELKEKAEKALKAYEIADKERKKLEAQKLIERAKSMIDAKYFNKAIEDLDEALKLDTTQQTKIEVENLRKTIQQ